jgi:secretion/DNA translocation related CpaE-like protein
VAVLPGARTWLLDRLRTLPGATSTACVVGVIGGAGGAGASTLAAGLATTGARPTGAGLLDDDPLGGGLDLAIGAESAPGLRWPDLATVRGRLDGAALLASLPAVAGARVLSHDRGATPVDIDALASVSTAMRSELELVVVDLGRSPEVGARVAAAAAGTVLLVTPADVRAVAAAAATAATLTAASTDVRVVVSRRWSADRLEARDVARVLGLPLVGWWRFDVASVRALHRGEPPRAAGRGSLGALCGQLVDRLASRRSVA